MQWRHSVKSAFGRAGRQRASGQGANAHGSRSSSTHRLCDAVDDAARSLGRMQADESGGSGCHGLGKLWGILARAAPSVTEVVGLGLAPE